MVEGEDQSPEATAAAGAGGDGESEDFPARTAKDFSELMGLCKAWEKDAPLASLALEGALSCLRSLEGGSRRSPAQADGGGKGKAKVAGGGDSSKGAQEALEGAFEALAAVVDQFFVKRRGGGLTPVQVRCRLFVFGPVLLGRFCWDGMGWLCSL